MSSDLTSRDATRRLRLIVLGAAGGVGRHAVTHAVGRGHAVLAAARSELTPPPEGAGPLRVDVRDAGAVRAALEGVDAVLWCVGVTKRSGPDVGRAALPGVVEAMSANGVRRIVTVSGAGVTLPGDEKGFGARAVSALTRRFARDLVEDKAGEHEVLAGSWLDWTEVRPPRLVEREGTGRYALGDEAPGPSAKPVAKADVALALLQLAEREEWVRRSPFLTAG